MADEPFSLLMWDEEVPPGTYTAVPYFHQTMLWVPGWFVFTWTLTAD